MDLQTDGCVVNLTYSTFGFGAVFDSSWLDQVTELSAL